VDGIQLLRTQREGLPLLPTSLQLELYLKQLNQQIEGNNSFKIKGKT
jgi:hypothetical protein